MTTEDLQELFNRIQSIIDRVNNIENRISAIERKVNLIKNNFEDINPNDLSSVAEGMRRLKNNK